jgi:hypothetical protein
MQGSEAPPSPPMIYDKTESPNSVTRNSNSSSSLVSSACISSSHLSESPPSTVIEVAISGSKNSPQVLASAARRVDLSYSTVDQVSARALINLRFQ